MKNILNSYLRHYLFLLTVSAIFNSGCACSRYHILSKKSPADFADKKAIILLHDSNEPIKANQVEADSDFVYYFDSKTKMKRKVPVKDVKQVTLIDHSKGAKEGFRTGLITGLALVGISAAITAGEEYDGDGPPATILVYFAAIGGAGFSLLSTMIGAASGSRDIYEFEKTEAQFIENNRVKR